jgi:hypothetical protein
MADVGENGLMRPYRPQILGQLSGLCIGLVAAARATRMLAAVTLVSGYITISFISAAQDHLELGRF